MTKVEQNFSENYLLNNPFLNYVVNYFHGTDVTYKFSLVSLVDMAPMTE